MFTAFRKSYIAFITIFITLNWSFSAGYREPKIKNPLTDNSISISSKNRTVAATLLANYTKCQLEALIKKDVELLTKLVGLSLLLEEHNKDAVVLNVKLKRPGSTVEYQETITSRALAEHLLKIAAPCKEGGKEKDLMFLGCLLDLLAQLDPNYDALIYEQELFPKKNEPADWSFLGESPKPEDISVPEPDTGRRVVKAILQKAYANKNKNLEKQQSTIKGLMTLTADDGGSVGTTMDIIATIRPPKQENMFTYGLLRATGQNMQTSLEEAFSAVRVRYPFIEASEMKISFGDKYSPKDGGSAGAAFFLVMIGILDGIDYDSDFALTGDVTVDWKVREVGGIREKILGATRGKCKTVAIPMVNEKSLNDLVILNSPAALWNIQIMGISTLEEAVELARTDKTDENIALAARFTKVQSFLKRKKINGIRNKALVKELKAILAEQPNNLSVKYLVKLTEGKLSKKLSIEASINELFILTPKLTPYIIGAYRLPSLSDNELETMLKKLNRAKAVVNSKTYKTHAALVKFVEDKKEEGLANEAVKNSKTSKTRSKKYTKYNEARSKASASLKKLREEIQTLVSDHKVLEAMLSK